MRQPFKRLSAPVDAPIRALVAKIASTIAAADPATHEEMEADIFMLSQACLPTMPMSAWRRHRPDRSITGSANRQPDAGHAGARAPAR